MFFPRDVLLPWCLEWPRRSKTKKTYCFSLLFMQKSRKSNGFAHFFVPLATTSPGSLGSLSTAATISKSYETHTVFQYFLQKSYENTLLFNGLGLYWGDWHVDCSKKGKANKRLPFGIQPSRKLWKIRRSRSAWKKKINYESERYDPSTNTWESLTSMTTARKGVASAVLNGKLYAICASSSGIR